MCKRRLIRHFFVLVLLTNVLGDKSWCDPFSRQAAASVIGIAAKEDNNESTTQEQKSDKIYSGTEEYDKEDIIEEEFPLDEREEEETDRKASEEVVPEKKENKQSAGFHVYTIAIDAGLRHSV